MCDISKCGTFVGIGLEGHEPPYLRGGSDDIIQSGHTFSNEPGVYIEGQVMFNLVGGKLVLS